MRIISGTLKGRKLSLPKGVETRPTTDRVKESLFSVIEARRGLKEAEVLDLFAGSGGLSFEAISRGAKKATLIESNNKLANHLKATAKELEIGDKVVVLGTAVEAFIRGTNQKYDIIFCDPPYRWPYAHKVIEAVLENEWLTDGGWLVLEHDQRQLFTDHPHCVYSKPYGNTMISIFLQHRIED